MHVYIHPARLLQEDAAGVELSKSQVCPSAVDLTAPIRFLVSQQADPRLQVCSRSIVFRVFPDTYVIVCFGSRTESRICPLLASVSYLGPRSHAATMPRTR